MRSWWQDRKKRRITMWGLLGLTAALAGLIWVGSTAVAQPGPGGRPGARPMATMGMMLLERTWAALNFEIKASPEQLMKLYPAYQKAWDERKQAQQEAREKQDRTILRNALQQLQTDLQAQLKEVLTQEQLDQLQKWLQEQSQLMGPRAGRRPQ